MSFFVFEKKKLSKSFNLKKALLKINFLVLKKGFKKCSSLNFQSFLNALSFRILITDYVCVCVCLSQNITRSFLIISNKSLRSITLLRSQRAEQIFFRNCVTKCFIYFFQIAYAGALRLIGHDQGMMICPNRHKKQGDPVTRRVWQAPWPESKPPSPIKFLLSYLWFVFLFGVCFANLVYYSVDFPIFVFCLISVLYPSFDV